MEGVSFRPSTGLPPSCGRRGKGKEAALPVVLSAHVSAGQESNLRGPKAPGVRPGAVPRRPPAVGSVGSRPAAAPIPLLAISSVFKVLFGRARPSPYRQMGVPCWPGRGESSPVPGEAGDRSATGSSPLWLSSAVPGPQNKGAASLRKRLLDGSPDFQKSWSSRQGRLRVEVGPCNGLGGVSVLRRGHRAARRGRGSYPAEVPGGPAVSRVQEAHDQ
jgi:hypothetical protein